MKRQLVLPSALTVLLTVVFVLLASQSAFGKKKKDGGKGCEDIEIALQTIVDFNTFTAVGTVSGDLKGTVEFVGDVTSVAPVTGQLLPPTRDAISFTGEVTFFTKHGSITTRNVGVFQPGPFGVGVEFGTVIAGTGKYAEATGIISFAVASDETGTRFSENGRGTICTPDEDD